MANNAEDSYRVVLFTNDWPDHACPVVRAARPIREAGMQLLWGTEWQDDAIHIFPERVDDADIVVVQRDFPLHEEAYEAVIESANAQSKPVIYDLDDLLLDLPDVHPDRDRYGRSRFPILRAILESDAVTASSPALRSFLRKFNRNTWLLPNYLVDEIWSLGRIDRGKKDLSNRPVIIGYMGGHSHAPDLEMVAPVLDRLLDKYGDSLLLHLWGLPPPSDLVDRENVALIAGGVVDYAEFARYFISQQCDIFIAPLQDNLFNRSKSQIKFLEYSALGVPGVYSSIEPYESVVLHGENGYLASAEAEWEDFLTRLIENPTSRIQLGKQAQRTVRDHWMLSNHAHEWSETYRQIALSKRDRKRPEAGLAVYHKLHAWYRDLQQEVKESRPLKHNQDHVAQIEQLSREMQLQVTEKARALLELEEEIREKDQSIETMKVQLAKQRIELEELQERISESKKSEKALSARLKELNFNKAAKERDNIEMRAQLAEITGSTSWNLLQMIWRIRLVLAPRGGLLERLMHQAIGAFHLLGSKGFKAFVRRIIEKLNAKIGWRRSLDHEVGGLARERGLGSLAYSAEPGEVCPDPAISILIIREHSIKSAEEEAITNWINKQTLQSVEVVVWSRDDDSAWELNSPEAPWHAPSLQSLCQGLSGRYMCVATPDLLNQAETYLETNLIALETESLTFTVNTHDSEGSLLRRLEKGLLPGVQNSPLLRQVVRKDSLRDEFNLDLSQQLEEGTPRVVGKLLVQTTSNPESDDVLPFELDAMHVKLTNIGRHILAIPNDPSPSAAIRHITHPVDTVLPASRMTSERPTVIIVMPYLAVGGAERVALNVMRQLEEKIRFVVVTVEEHASALGTTADAFRQISPYVYTLSDFLATHLTYSCMCYLVERFEPRTIYIANGASWIYDALSTLKAHFPDLRMVNQVYDHQAGWINRYDAALVISLDAHIGVNQKICQAYLDRGAMPEHVYLIAHGIDFDEFDLDDYSGERRHELRSQLGLPEEGKVITFIARLDPQKRPMDFIELARWFRNDPSIVFLMVGDGPLAKWVDAEVSRAGLTNLVRRTFYQPSSDIYAISDVVVLPSEFEGMPLVVLEAQAMGRAVVVTDVGNNREVLDITEGGIVVPRIGDVGALSEGVRHILQNPVDPLKVRRAAMQRYNLERIAQEYERAMLGEKGG